MQAPFIAFWSAHGGVGRTLAVWNIGHVLARRGLQVLLIDFDLDSPGLTRLLDGVSAGLVELLVGSSAAPDLAESVGGVDDVAGSIERCCVAVEGDERLRVLPAGRLDAAYWDRVDAWRREGGADALAQLRRRIAAIDLADVVLVDVGAGLARATERVARAFGDHLIVGTGLGRQHVAGTAELLRRWRGQSVRVVLGPLPPGEDELTAARERAAQGAFAAAWGGPIDLSRRIEHHPRTLLHEQPHAARERGPVYAAHVELAEQLLADVGLEIDAVLAGVAAAIAADDWARATQRLRLAVVLDPGGESLAATYTWLRDRMAPAPASDLLFALLAEALPVDSPRYPGFAIALHRAGNPRARRFYARYLEFAPGHADMLGNFAACLTEVCGEHDLAEDFYERALAADPADADHRGNFANFLALVRGDRERADACYRETIARAPDDAHHLGNYANFRVAAYADVAGAEALYRRALAVEPDDPGLLGNVARLLFAAGRAEEARGLLARALAAEVDPVLRCELCFYAYAHAPELLPDALAELRALLAAGVRSPGWDLRANVERACSEGHPAPERLAALARVITDAAPLAEIDLLGG